VKLGRAVTVSIIPNCDFCAAQGIDRAAFANARIAGHGWAYVCKQHFIHYRCHLGTGWGQQLILNQVPSPRDDDTTPGQQRINWQYND
jgi:hypothetical protein